MTDHTPGPITVEREDRCPFSIIGKGKDGRVLWSESAHSYSTRMRSSQDLYTGYGFDYEDRPAVIEANKRQWADALLRAAGPDLLTAAQKAIDECVDLIGTDAGEALSAAIAKAKGEKP